MSNLNLPNDMKSVEVSEDKIILNKEYSKKRLLLMERLIRVNYRFGCYSDQAEKVENDIRKLYNKYISDLSGMS